MLGKIRNSASALRIFRGIRTNAILREIKPADTKTTSTQRATSDKILDIHSHTPTEWEKKILVWTKIFPNKESIPKKVRMDTMQTAMSRGRIRIANYMIAFAALGCLYIIIRGKQHVSEEMKNADTEHNDFRRQITAEYRSLKADEAKK